MRVLVVGLGSIAEKHIYVLREINPKIELYALRSSVNSKKQKQFTVAEYEAAAKHMDANLYSFVYHQVFASSFISGNKLLYSTKDKNGTTFILVNSRFY